MTEQRLIETWEESGKYDEALALLQSTLEIDPELVDHVKVKVITVNPDSTTTMNQVTFQRRFESVEVEE